MLLFRLRNRHLLLIDLILLTLAPALALMLRLDQLVPRQYEPALLAYTVLALLIKLPVFYTYGLYNRLWRYASMEELINIASAVALAGVLVALAFYGLLVSGLLGPAGHSFPRSLPLLDAGLTLLFVGGARFAVRAAEYYQARRLYRGTVQRVLIVGAGKSGSLLARELRTNPRSGLQPVGFIDDDPGKRSLHIHGVPVLGPSADLADLARATAAQEVLIAMPSASGKTIREIVQACQEAGLPSRTLPSLAEIVSGRVSVAHLRPVNLEDLLRRDPVQTDLSAVRGMLAGRRVLITGAGGSIGAELCRQIARCSPAQIIALGHGENSLFQLAQDLGREFKDMPAMACDLQLVVADIRDRPRLAAVYQRFKPQVVFHAAAHKHVPLMESNLEDAVTNNVLGTRHLLELAVAHDVERFVLISSDKAVNPTSVMGVTKRIAELLVDQVAQRCGRPFVSVRFGNVLGSRGSVLPILHEQIAAGGPLTITHPDMQRYFMTIPEAVQLVLQAAVLGQPGRVFVLDMGQPVKLVDLARDLVRLSGLELGRDLDLIYTGPRPGEKLFEELFGGEEDFIRTAHSKVFVAQNGHLVPGALTFSELVDRLLTAAQNDDTEQTRYWLQQLVPEYRPDPQLSAMSPQAQPADPDPSPVLD